MKKIKWKGGVSFILSPLFAVIQCTIYLFENDWLKFDVSLVIYLGPTMCA